MNKIIDIKSISKSYETGSSVQKILTDASLCVNKGEMLSIIGESGSGKSTLLNILGLIDSDFEGKYSLDGADVTKLNDNKLAGLRNRKIGFVFQSFHLIKEMTALQNVLLVKRLSRIHERNTERTKDMIEASKSMLVKVGLENEMDKRPSQLSGGQKQRVAIARAIIKSPEIILADEPTGSLDHHTSQTIMSLFEKLHDEGNTILIVTHDMDIAKRCDRVLQIRDGVIENIK